MDMSNYSLHNSSNEVPKIDHNLYLMYERNRSVSDQAYYLLIAAYSLLILVGSIGNFLVLLALFRGRRKMMTARNTFIANLALADTSLCIFTTPMTMIDILTKYWPFGVDTSILCKVARTALAVTVFFSSFNIAIIAIDRYRFIVTPSKRQVTVCEAMIISGSALVVALILSSPIGMYTTLQKMFDEPGEYDHISYCIEVFTPMWRMVYSIASTIFQHVLPSIIVSVAYMKVSQRLSTRFMTTNERQMRMAIKRRRQCNVMLISVSITHFVSWLPLNLFNLITSLQTEEQLLEMFPSVENMLCLYAACHISGMSSACLNPILYAFLNENFKNEFALIFKAISENGLHFGKCLFVQPCLGIKKCICSKN